MALNRKSPLAEKNTDSNVEYDNIPEGQHEGRLVYVADLGLQERSYKGEEKPPAQQLSLGIELVGKTITIDGKEQPRVLWTRPFNIFYQLNDMGKELAMYKVFSPTAKEGQVADWDSVLGLPCDVTVVHKQGTDGNTYDNIDNITGIPERYQDNVGAALTTDMAVGDSEDENNPATKALFGLAKYIHGKRLSSNAPVLKSVTADESKEEFKDDIPF